MAASRARWPPWCSPSRAPTQLKSLEAGGLVARTTNTSNRRLVQVSLTDKGKQMLAESIPIQAERERAWLAILTARELATLQKIVHRLMSQPAPE